MSEPHVIFAAGGPYFVAANGESVSVPQIVEMFRTVKTVNEAERRERIGKAVLAGLASTLTHGGSVDSVKLAKAAIAFTDALIAELDK